MKRFSPVRDAIPYYEATPIEIWRIILTFLPIHELLALQVTCHQLYTKAESELKSIEKNDIFDELHVLYPFKKAHSYDDNKLYKSLVHKWHTSDSNEISFGKAMRICIQNTSEQGTLFSFVWRGDRYRLFSRRGILTTHPYCIVYNSDKVTNRERECYCDRYKHRSITRIVISIIKDALVQGLNIESRIDIYCHIPLAHHVFERLSMFKCHICYNALFRPGDKHTDRICSINTSYDIEPQKIRPLCLLNELDMSIRGRLLVDY